MLWHYDKNPEHVELFEHEQHLLGIAVAFPEPEVLSEALFQQHRIEDRARRAAKLAAEILVHEMAATPGMWIDHQNIIGEVYDMSPLHRPGIIVGDTVSTAKFVYTHQEAELLQLPERYADDGMPYGGMLALTDVMPDGIDSLWDYREILLTSPVEDADDLAVNARLECVDGAISYVNEWLEKHPL